MSSTLSEITRGEYEGSLIPPLRAITEGYITPVLSMLPSNIKDIRDGDEVWIPSDSYTWAEFMNNEDLAFIEDYEVKGNTLSVRSYNEWACVPCQNTIDITGIDHKDIIEYLASYVPPYIKKIYNKDITLAEVSKKHKHFYNEDYRPPLMWSKVVTEKVRESIAYVINFHFRACGSERQEFMDLFDVYYTVNEKVHALNHMELDSKYDRVDIFYRLKDGTEESLWNVHIDVDEKVVMNFFRSLLPLKLMSLL